MPAPKGHKRYGGRTKGTPNKPKAKVLELVRETGQDPLVVLAKMLSDPEIENVKFAAAQLMPYCYPKLSAVVHSEDPDNPPGQGAKSEVLEKLKELHAQQAKERKRV